MELTIPLPVLRSFRAVLRRLLPGRSLRSSCPLVYIQASPTGLFLLARLEEFILRRHLTGTFATAVFGFAGEAFNHFEQSGNGNLTLELKEPSQLLARWEERGVPCEVAIDAVTPDGIERLPALPEKMATLPPSFLAALAEAVRTTTKLDGRYAVSRILLRGGRGEVVATDGKQLLIQSGFNLPWKEDLLVPPLCVLGSRDLRHEGDVGLGRHEDWVALQVGPWTFQLALDAAGRYPKVDAVIPKETDTPTRLCLSFEDAEHLKGTLPRLPGKDDDSSPITLDLGKKAIIRAREQGQDNVTELVLEHSTVSGPPVSIATDRKYLLRALQLGFRELWVGKTDRPLVCRCENSLYLWMLLGAGGVIPPARNALRVVPSERPGQPSPSNPRRKSAMPQPRPQHPPGTLPAPAPAALPESNGRSEREPLANLEEAIAEVENLRNSLQDAQARLARLAATLKQLRRQTRAVQAAVTTLKHL